MNAWDILFRTSRFNLSVVKPHFINPCCFGEDLAQWLSGKLTEKKIEASQPGQEDWGWYLKTSQSGNSYFLGMNGVADKNSAHRDEGEWRIIVQRKRTLWEWFTRRGRITDRDPLILAIQAILHSESEFRDIRVEDSRTGCLRI